MPIQPEGLRQQVAPMAPDQGAPVVGLTHDFVTQVIHEDRLGNKKRLDDVPLQGTARTRLDSAVKFIRQGSRLGNVRTLLLVGESGTGKTLTAHALAGEVEDVARLYTIDTAQLKSSYQSETGRNTRETFAQIIQEADNAVAAADPRANLIVFIDEFGDAANTQDGAPADYAAMVNEFAKGIDFLKEQGKLRTNRILLLAATNEEAAKKVARRFERVELKIPQDTAERVLVLESIVSSKMQEEADQRAASRRNGYSAPKPYFSAQIERVMHDHKDPSKASDEQLAARKELVALLTPSAQLSDGFAQGDLAMAVDNALREAEDQGDRPVEMQDIERHVQMLRTAVATRRGMQQGALTRRS